MNQRDFHSSSAYQPYPRYCRTGPGPDQHHSAPTESKIAELPSLEPSVVNTAALRSILLTASEKHMSRRKFPLGPTPSHS